MGLEGFDDVGDSGSLLTNGDIDAEKLFVDVSGVEVSLLVDDGINGDGGFSGLSVTDDEFSLSSADGDQAVDCLESGLHRFVDGFPGNDAGCFDFYSFPLGGFDGSQSVDGVSEGIEDSS